MRLYGGRPFARAEHLERMALSASNLRLELDLPAHAADIDALLDAAGPQDALLRVLATRGGHRAALLEPLPIFPPAFALASITFAPVQLLDGIKSLSYAANMLATRAARERGFDDALLVSPQGEVLELPTASFFCVCGGELLTPPLSAHVLDSITRRIVLEECGAREGAVVVGDLARAEEAFIASTVAEVLPVRRFEDLEIPADGPITLRCAQAVSSRIAAALG
jgi:branched-chain amino acid aminotransferase